VLKNNIAMYVTNKTAIKKSFLIVLILIGLSYLLTYKPAPRFPKISKKIPKNNEPEQIYISLRVLPKIEKKQLEKKKKQKTVLNTKKEVARHFKYTHKKVFVDKGKELLGEKGKKIGFFPEIKVNYRKYLGITKYLTVMNSLGGKFYIINMGTGQIAARIDLDARKLSLQKKLAGLSPRSRLIEDEPSLFKYIDAAKVEFGKGDYEVILLLPLEIDHYIIGALSDITKNLGNDIMQFSSFCGVYVLKGNDLFLGIYKGKFKNGKMKHLNASMKLTS